MVPRNNTKCLKWKLHEKKKIRTKQQTPPGGKQNKQRVAAQLETLGTLNPGDEYAGYAGYYRGYPHTPHHRTPGTTVSQCACDKQATPVQRYSITW